MPEADASSTRRVVAQRTFFAGPFLQCPERLYAERLHGNITRARNQVTLDPHSQLSMNTYFGRFPASYWQRWTAIQHVEITATTCGGGRLAVLASDIKGGSRVVVAREVSATCQQQVTIRVPVDRFVDGGAMWLDAWTGDTSLTVGEVCWSVPPPPRSRRTSVVITTFNRPVDCTQTLEVLAGDDECLRVVDAVHVVDQGDETVEDRAGFADVHALLGSKLRYRRQPNLGGAGGFTRGLYETAATDGARHPNVLFMDDDILLEPDTVVRLTAFANSTVAPVIAGSQLLLLLHPTQAHSWAQTTILPELRAGVPVPRQRPPVDLIANRQEVRVDAGYNAWWSCLIPAEIVSKAGYPLPMFFRWDDVEYGHRARAQGYSTVTLPGAGVWHADWNWKDGDDATGYFNQRNALITSALHGRFDSKSVARLVRKRLLRELVSMRYGLVATQLKAIEDFLDGPDCLHDGGAEAVAAVQKLRAEYPETYCHAASAVPGVRADRVPLAPAPPAPSRQGLVLAKRLAWQLLGRTRGGASIRARDTYWWHVSRFATAVVTDASQQGVRLRRLDRSELVARVRHVVRVTRRLRRKGVQARQQYRARLPELTSRQNWQRLFDES